MLKVESDPQADAIYVYLSDQPVEYTKEIDKSRYVDFGVTGNPIGIDLLGVSGGVDLEDLPQADEVGKILMGLGIRILV